MACPGLVVAVSTAWMALLLGVIGILKPLPQGTSYSAFDFAAPWDTAVIDLDALEDVRQDFLNANRTLLNDGTLSASESISILERKGRPPLVAISSGSTIVFAEHRGPESLYVVGQVEVGGLALGGAFDRASGAYFFCNAVSGLFSARQVDGESEWTVQLELAGTVLGRPLALCDDVAVDTQGRLYLSDASHLHPQPRGSGRFDAVEACSADIAAGGEGSGRLIRYNPATKRSEALLEGLHFANGVTLAEDDSYVLVNETMRFRVHRVWLKGPRAGQSEVFATLPGFPDNIRASRQGGFWVALFSGVHKGKDDHFFGLIQAPTWARWLFHVMPEWVKEKLMKTSGMAVHLDTEGRLTHVARFPPGAAAVAITHVTEFPEGQLLIGGMTVPYILSHRL